jgi:hypothetical protein
MLQMARKTGALLVNRDGLGNTIEQGVLILQNGQIIDASLGPYRGAEALQRLLGWQLCYFVLQMLPSSSGPLLPPPQMSPVNGNGVTGFNAGANPKTGPLRTSNVPLRRLPANEVLPHFNHFGLTRLHRQLFLLIDGQRSVSELILLIGHRTEEVDILLDDLERAGLIQR